MTTPETAEHDAYPPQALHDYAFLADGERGALVGPRGEIAWLCAPRWHSGAVLSTLIGGTGLYAVTPKGRFVPGGHLELAVDVVPDPVEAAGIPGQFERALVGNGPAVGRLDVFGEALLLFAAAARHDRLDRGGRQAAEIAVAAIAARWSEPDAGIWELDDRAWTHSRLICAAGLRRIAAVAPDAAREREWTELADTILAHTTAHALHPDGHWQRAPDDPGLDAALLLPPVRGLLPADDPRTRATLHACTENLARDHYAYRFRHDERPLEEAEGAFLLCGFVTALAEHHQGREVEAHRWFQRNRGACGAAGLYSEEYDTAQRQLRGNLPQAFVHALMLDTAATLARTPGLPS
jgi:hypothetical protein